jgi:RNA recognition motif-containing protein
MKGKYAFITFQSGDDAKAAIEGMDGKAVRGHDLTVQQTRKLKYQFLLRRYCTRSKQAQRERTHQSRRVLQLWQNWSLG